jgi:predicted O-methyltransferase YrrM
MNPSLSYVFSELYKRYKHEGLDVYGGFSPFLTGFLQRTGNYIARGSVFLSTSAGISNDEAVFMHGLCERMNPKRILIIGNSYGFSTVFLALSCPDAKLIAFDKYRTQGIETTNRLLSGLKGKAVIQASTPEDIPNIINSKLDGEVDFVLIDAVHTNEMQTAEFEVLNGFLSSRSTVVFHDVLSCGLLESFSMIKNKYLQYDFRLIGKSSTGIAVCIKGEKDELLENFLDYFSPDEKKILDFNCLMLQHANASSSNLFSKHELQYKFMPHPQL